MMIRWLNRNAEFPDVHQATEDGIVAIGGDLSPDRLIEGYRRGIFPWYSAGQPIVWWSPDPRAIIPLDRFHVGKTLGKTLKRGLFEVTVNQAFDAVIDACADAHDNGRGPGWLTPEMITAYRYLHRLGHAHSVETWRDGMLAGGLYGVSFQGFFAGESMFHRVTDASKVALVGLVERMRERGLVLLDCQMTTPATLPFGAVDVSRQDYLDRLERAWSLAVRF